MSPSDLRAIMELANAGTNGGAEEGVVIPSSPRPTDLVTPENPPEKILTVIAYPEVVIVSEEEDEHPDPSRAPQRPDVVIRQQSFAPQISEEEGRKITRDGVRNKIGRATVDRVLDFGDKGIKAHKIYGEAQINYHQLEPAEKRARNEARQRINETIDKLGLPICEKTLKSVASKLKRFSSIPTPKKEKGAQGAFRQTVKEVFKTISSISPIKVIHAAEEGAFDTTETALTLAMGVRLAQKNLTDSLIAGTIERLRGILTPAGYAEEQKMLGAAITGKPNTDILITHLLQDDQTALDENQAHRFALRLTRTKPHVAAPTLPEWFVWLGQYIGHDPKEVFEKNILSSATTAMTEGKLARACLGSLTPEYHESPKGKDRSISDVAADYLEIAVADAGDNSNADDFKSGWERILRHYADEAKLNLHLNDVFGPVSQRFLADTVLLQDGLLRSLAGTHLVPDGKSSRIISSIHEPFLQSYRLAAISHLFTPKGKDEQGKSYNRKTLLKRLLPPNALSGLAIMTELDPQERELQKGLYKNGVIQSLRESLAQSYDFWSKRIAKRPLEYQLIATMAATSAESYLIGEDGENEIAESTEARVMHAWKLLIAQVQDLGSFDERDKNLLEQKENHQSGKPVDQNPALLKRLDREYCAEISASLAVGLARLLPESLAIGALDSLIEKFVDPTVATGKTRILRPEIVAIVEALTKDTAERTMSSEGRLDINKKVVDILNFSLSSLEGNLEEWVKGDQKVFESCVRLIKCLPDKPLPQLSGSVALIGEGSAASENNLAAILPQRRTVFGERVKELEWPGLTSVVGLTQQRVGLAFFADLGTRLIRSYAATAQQLNGSLSEQRGRELTTKGLEGQLDRANTAADMASIEIASHSHTRRIEDLQVSFATRVADLEKAREAATFFIKLLTRFGGDLKMNMAMNEEWIGQGKPPQSVAIAWNQKHPAITLLQSVQENHMSLYEHIVDHFRSGEAVSDELMAVLRPHLALLRRQLP